MRGMEEWKEKEEGWERRERGVNISSDSPHTPKLLPLTLAFWCCQVQRLD